jgi:hypothetical protein
MCVCVYIYMCIYIYVCVCMCASGGTGIKGGFCVFSACLRWVYMWFMVFVRFCVGYKCDGGLG